MTIPETWEDAIVETTELQTIDRLVAPGEIATGSHTADGIETPSAMRQGH